MSFFYTNQKSKLKFVLATLSVFIMTPAAHAAVYKCLDNSGKITYTDARTSTCKALLAVYKKTTLAVEPKKLATDSVFAASSFWYKPIPQDAKLDPNSSNLTNEFIRQKNKYFGTVTINTFSYSSPVYTPLSDVKPVKVAFDNCQKKSYVDSTFTSMVSAVPIPTYAVPSEGTDGEMTIYDASSHTIWELWKASKDSNGNWKACWGGKMENTTSNVGVFKQFYGTTATGLPFLGGQITAEELERGEIKHVMGISLVDLASWAIVSWPANRSDGYNPTNAPNRIAEGQRFRLDPKINVDSLQLSKAGKVIAKAAQKYGFVVWDKAGAISLRAQNTTSYTSIGKVDPYPTLFENRPRYSVLNNFPWDKLQFLPIHYGRP